MNFFLDTEFHEGFHKPLFGRKRHFIDLISIGLFAGNDRSYYAVSKDFDIKAAWDSYQIDKVPVHGDQKNIYIDGYMEQKVYWLRYNVLRPIFFQLWKYNATLQNIHGIPKDFTYHNFKRLILMFGKSLSTIKSEVMDMVGTEVISIDAEQNNFYGYYSDYDWVAFCGSLFGKMNDLPSNFPMYMRDLKQVIDAVATQVMIRDRLRFPQALAKIKADINYPKRENEHTADADALWNFRLYHFLITYLLNAEK